MFDRVLKTLLHIVSTPSKFQSTNQLHCTKYEVFIKISLLNVTKFADLITFTEEILNGKLLFCAVLSGKEFLVKVNYIFLTLLN